MNAIIEETKFRVLSDLLDKESDKLIDKILHDNINNRYFISKSIVYNPEATDSNLSNKVEGPEATNSNSCNKVEKFFDLPKYNEPEYDPPTSFQVIQEWEGYVQEINENENTFTATLLDITANKSSPTEEADFNLNIIHEFDHHFLRVGAVFRWVIGYHLKRTINKKGYVSVTKISSSDLVFRRMPKWSESSLNKAVKKAKEFKDEIIWE